MIQQQTRTRTSSPARWMKAAARAVAEGVQVRQLAGSGQWIANSGSDSAVAYEVEVTGNIADGCGCLAGPQRRSGPQAPRRVLPAHRRH